MANMNCLERLSLAIVSSMERFFYRYGLLVARNPGKVILFCFLVTGVAAIGFLNFRMEVRPEKLWIPQNSDYIKTLDWQHDNFPNDVRHELALFEAENVLTPEYIKEMFRIQKEVHEAEIMDQYGRKLRHEDMCVRVPALGGRQGAELTNIKTQLFPDRDPSLPFDWSLEFEDDIYCQFYNRMPMACLELSILDMWERDEDAIHDLTQEDIINRINNVNMSAIYAYPINFVDFLSEVTRNSTGHVIGARATIHSWFMKVNRSEVRIGAIENNAGLAEEVDFALYTWEASFLSILQNVTEQPEGLGVFYQAARSFSEISSNTVYSDVFFLAVGEATLFIYVQIMLGKFNLVEQRPLLSTVGLFSVFMAVVVAFGFCSALGVTYGPVHSILPLLMLGLGVDDMFVTVQSLTNLKGEERRHCLERRIALAVKHAGVAVTVTSLTDFVAFFIGSTTILPALRSFCIYAAVGIIMLYAFQTSFFTAWLVLDQKRMEEHRNGFFWCIKHKDWTPNACSQREFLQTFFRTFYPKIIFCKPVKALVIMGTLGLFGTSVWGCLNLRQEFNPVWFIPQSSYMFQFLSRAQRYYPEAGVKGILYLGELDYPQELPKIHNLTSYLKDSVYISSVDSWYDHFINYTYLNTGENVTGMAMNKTYFNKLMGKFAFSPIGTRFQSSFIFEGKITCGHPTTRILANRIEYQHSMLSDTTVQITAMEEVQTIIADQQFSDFAAPIAIMYSSYETDKLITRELIQNLSLALAAVFIMTLILLANLISSIYVFICVAFTLVDVGALMTWWGLTIDIVSCINLVLCIGLCVDYSAHVALHFLKVDGTREERVMKTLAEIGTAVLNGSFSTFLAFIFLIGSDSHVFISFFKIFMGVSLFGTFHGLVFLPVVLSLVGSPPYSNHCQPGPPGDAMSLEAGSNKKDDYHAVATSEAPQMTS
ncbi:patched domain-containing protein 3-like [Oratosquilla oratoria]|uniref:patched domain-containing protein 3-like n=1 Tax=Oratosquilla oratoria TaxID=337810 RepID=UPI003F75D85A